MAVGDTVSDIFAITGSFQPAAGVEVCIFGLGVTAAGDGYRLDDGAAVASIRGQNITAEVQLKLFLTNTNYLTYTSAVNLGYYTGVQSK